MRSGTPRWNVTSPTRHPDHRPAGDIHLFSASTAQPKGLAKPTSRVSSAAMANRFSIPDSGSNLFGIGNTLSAL